MTEINRRAEFQGPKADKLGRKAIAQLKKNLMKHLIEAMKSGGAVAAVDVCSTKAQRLTAEVVRSLPKGVVIKRTSLRVRNPVNAPTESERGNLRSFARYHGSPGAPRFQSNLRDLGPGKSPEYHYFEPILMAPTGFNGG